MKIEAPGQKLAVPAITKVRKGAEPAEVKQPQEQATKVTLTDQVKVLSRKATVADVGELQAAQDAKIEAVKARVQAGTYQVSGRDLAKKMLSRSDNS